MKSTGSFPAKRHTNVTQIFKARGVVRGFDSIITGMAYVSGACFLVTAFFVVTDVVGRRFLNISTAVGDELGGYALAFGGMWSLAYTLRTGGHVRIDVLVSHLSRRLQLILSYAAVTVLGFFGLMVTIFTWSLTFDSFTIGARATSWIRTPLFLPQGLMALGFTVLTLEAFVILVFGLVEETGQENSTPPEVL